MKIAIGWNVLGVVALIGGVGCKGAGAAPAGDGCASDAYKSPDGAFCIVLPAGYQPDPPVDLEDGSKSVMMLKSSRGFGITYTTKDVAGAAEANESFFDMHTKGFKNARGGGDLPGGKWLYRDDGKSQKLFAYSKSAKASVTCDTMAQSIAPEVVEACKSVRAR